MTLRTALRLGRVSNLPTVWTNTATGIVLAGATSAGGAAWAALLAATTLLYVGGMWLNDAFDARVDARERPGRPIPSGAAAPGAVFAGGFAMLAGGVGLVGAASGGAAAGLASALGLAAAIVAYDRWHKGNPAAPLLMGLCRALVYLTAGLAAGGMPSAALLGGAAALWLYIVGLSWVARHETLAAVANAWPLLVLAAPVAWAAHAAGAAAGPLAAVALLVAWLAWALLVLRRGDVPGTVVRLIAGVSLLDAALLAAAGASVLALAAVAAVPLTRLLQRHVPGT